MISIFMQVIDFDTTQQFDVSIFDILVILFIFDHHFEHTVHITLIDEAKDSVGDPSETRYDELNRIFTAKIEPVSVQHVSRQGHIDKSVCRLNNVERLLVQVNFKLVDEVWREKEGYTCLLGQKFRKSFYSKLYFPFD